MLTLLAPWVRFWPLALALSAFAGGWTINGWRWEARHAAELQEQLDARAAMEQLANQYSRELEEKLAKIDKDKRTLARKLDHELRKPDYDCPVPADGVRLLREAITSVPAASEPGGPVP